jgi:hypothetical protein
MSLGSFFTIIEQAIAIILSIGVLYLLHIWMAGYLEHEEPRKVTLEIARLVRWNAFQSSIEIQQSDDSFEGHRRSKSSRIEQAPDNVMNTEKSGENASNRKTDGLGKDQMRNQEGSFPLFRGDRKKMTRNQIKNRRSFFGGIEMKTMEILRKKSTYGYILLILMAGVLMTACDLTSDVTPTPVDPTFTPIVLSGSISGVVWSDECQNFGDTLPAGCVQANDNAAYIGNGILDNGESGVDTAQVLLGVGLCPSEGLAETVTSVDGRFSFADLVPGDYCVTVKDTKGSPGFWTYPQVVEISNVSWTSITVKAGEIVSNINFGRDYFDELPPSPTETPVPACTDQAQFVRDVSVLDGTRFDPGESFTKTWRLRNSGTCTWTTDYALVHWAGYSLLGPDVMLLPSEVEPGELIDISVKMKAPLIEGEYEGFWKLRNDEGSFFGIGDSSDTAIWVSIEVGQPEPEFPDWRGEYFDNKNLDGEPKFLKNDRTLDKTWGLRSPDEDYLPRDNFSVRWTRTLEFGTRTYRFFLDITDGAKLYIDDVLVLNEWVDGERRTVTVDVGLKSGEHEIKFEYYNASGGAVAQLSYEVVNESEFEGWKAMYWMNKTMDSDLVLFRDESKINFDWEDGGPVLGGRVDKFSALWKRIVDFEPGMYRFRAVADDGLRVYVDGALVIDEWHISNGSELYVIDLKLSDNHEITVLYYENEGAAKVHFEMELIEPDNYAPEVVNDEYSISEDELLEVTTPGVLSNDVDLDGDDLTVSLGFEASNGVVELSADGSFVYTPEPGFSGEDSFGYVASDGVADSEIGTVLITVLAEDAE